MEFTKQYLNETGRALLSSASKKDKEDLLWAHRKRYILLQKAPSGAYTYTKEDLEKARMWRIKDET